MVKSGPESESGSLLRLRECRREVVSWRGDLVGLRTGRAILLGDGLDTGLAARRCSIGWMHKMHCYFKSHQDQLPTELLLVLRIRWH